MMSNLNRTWKRNSANLVFVSFLVAGFCNNAPFLTMLTAAHDLLKIDDPTIANRNATVSSRYDCNKDSTGTVLMFDVFSFAVRFVASFYSHQLRYWQRLIVVVALGSSAFLIVAFTRAKAFIYVGILFACLSTSFGDVTHLSLSTHYPTRLSFAAWAMGTGASGFVSTFFYASLTAVGMSRRDIFLLMLFVPFCMTVAFLILPAIDYHKNELSTENTHKDSPHMVKKKISVSIIEKNIHESTYTEPKINTLTMKQKFNLIETLFKYMGPLFVVYYSEYLINQGLFELIYFKNNTLISDHSAQYRWYNVAFRFTAFIARSSIWFVQIKKIGIFSVLQVINLVVLLTHVLFGFISSIEIVFVIILWEGLVGGACFANVFNLISTEVSQEYKEFSISISTSSEALGISLAGITAIYMHYLICSTDV